MLFDSVPYGLPSYVFSPEWFYGFDSVIESIAIIVSVLLVYYSYKCFKLTKENKYLYFSTAFLSLTFAFIAKIIGTLAIYKPTITRSALGSSIHQTFTSVTPSGINALAFIVYIFFILVGFMILFLIISRLTWKNQRVIALLVYFVFLATWISIVHYQLFYVTSFVLLLLITYSYYRNYREIKNEKAKFVLIAFSILLVSQAFFVFSIYSGIIYVLAELVQLLGFVYLLIPFILIFKKKPK
ncbi:MAG: hypothetical protein QF655_02490 [Candidatus Woesearchaeota archaeon]|jgi:hypothetical protein|nr:hypothetical protein [Candidatus Woesearchaeota archaeon]MDP6265326.1 hypothetical protein [Candidatus Woesearchaeota archaeon]MDP7323003.1 hypothetical protein [Candidatus Woesearchaeota archaeon]MDP7476473.1 hypothetical protein [Candidatus Woesearchaeota archaeon]HJO01306.1 hypothetical protein [Candidatus Woesearchaeota archaeon]